MASGTYGPTAQSNGATLAIPASAYNIKISIAGARGGTGGSDNNGSGGGSGNGKSGTFSLPNFTAITLQSYSGVEGGPGGSCFGSAGSAGSSNVASGGSGGNKGGCSGSGGGGGGASGVYSVTHSAWIIVAGGGGGGGGGSWNRNATGGHNAGGFSGGGTPSTANGHNGNGASCGDGGAGGGGGGGTSGGGAGSGGCDNQSGGTGGGGGGSGYNSSRAILLNQGGNSGGGYVSISYSYVIAEINYFRAIPNPRTDGTYNVELQWQAIDAASASIDQGVGSVSLIGTQTVNTGLSPSNEILTKTYTLTVTGYDGSTISQSITVAMVDGSVTTNNTSFYSSGPISFSSLRTNFKETLSGSISASELLRVTDTTNTDPIVPDATENADIGYLKNPNITGTTVTVSGQSYSVGGTSYPVQGKLWVPTSLPDNSIDLVVAYHGTIGLDPSPGATTILDASNTNLTLLKGNNIGIDDKIIFSVAYPQDGITATQNLNVLNPAQLSTFEFGDNLPYARAALLWAKNNLNSYIAGLGGTKTINNVYMFGHSQGGSLVHKLNTLETTNGAVVNAPGPIRLDITCENQENLGLVGPGKTLNPTNVTCQKLFNAYGSAATASEYQDVSLLYNYVTGHKAKITYLQALDDPTGGTSGVGQVYWMNELTAAMSANGQSYEYITVPTGGHDAFYKPQNTTLHRAIRGVVGGYGTNLSTSQFRNSIKYYKLVQSGGVINLDIDTPSNTISTFSGWNNNLDKNIVKTFTISGNCQSSDTYYYQSPQTPAAKFSSTTAHNLTIAVTGSVKGSDGMNNLPTSSGATSRTGSKLITPNSNGGNCMEIDVANGSITVDVGSSASIVKGIKFSAPYSDGAAITGTNYTVQGSISGATIQGLFLAS